MPREASLTLVAPSPPVLDLTSNTPTFNVVYAGLHDSSSVRSPSSYLKDHVWVHTLEKCIKGVSFGTVESNRLERADKLSPALEMCLKCHIAHRVHERKQRHYTLAFVADNLPFLSAALCLVGHVVDDIDTCKLEERLLKLPHSKVFEFISAALSTLEGC